MDEHVFLLLGFIFGPINNNNNISNNNLFKIVYLHI